MANTKISALTALTAPVPGDGLLIIDDYGGSPAEKIITLQNMLTVTNGLTEDTAPDRTADYVPTYDASTGASKKVLLKNAGAYTLFAGAHDVFAPADGTTYYCGCFLPYVWTTSAATRRVYIPRAGIIQAIDVIVCTYGTLGSAETSTMSFRLNNTTDTTISSAIVCNAETYHELKTGLSISVAAGDYFEIKWVTPTWATNPTNTTAHFTILVT